jgi:hypothetical protein
MPAKARENRLAKTRRWRRLHGLTVAAAAVSMAASRCLEKKESKR